MRANTEVHRGGAVQGGVEQRRHRRYRLSIPVEVRSPGKEASAVLTSSEDISAKGIYFVLSPGAELGSELELDLALPPQLCQGKNVRVHCHGHIVRREPPDKQGRIGVAAAIEEYEFIRGD